MAELDTGQDLLRHLLRRCGEILPTSADETTGDRLADARILLNEAHWWVCRQRDFRWARKVPPAQFVSVAADTVSVSGISGDTVTLSATLTPSRAGRKLMLDSDGLPHRISAHTAGTAVLTLATAYTGDSTSGAGTIFQDEFTVATDILAFPSIKEVWSGGRLELIPEGELNRIAPSNYLGVQRQWRKRYATFLTPSTVQIVPWTTTARLFECTYNYRPDPLTFDGVTATDTPIVPRDARAIIAWRAEWKLANDRKDTDRSGRAKEEVAELLQSMETSDLTFKHPRTFVPAGHRISGR